MTSNENRIEFFRECIETSKFYNPLKNFKLDSHLIEIRKDPLTGRRTRINIKRSSRPRQETISNKEVNEILRESGRDCMFCKRNIEARTPKFFEKIINLDRIKYGQCTLFPNLFPFGRYHAVGILSERHITNISEVGSNNFRDCFEACIDFFNRINEMDSTYIYPLISLNFLQPSGSSIVHPHVQALIEKEPYGETNLLIKESLSYYKKNSRNYWKDLFQIEKINGSRYIGKIGCVGYIASFAPRNNNEIIGMIFSNNSNFTGLKREEIKDLSLSLSKLFKAFFTIGLNSFNMSFHSGPMDRSISDYFSIIIKIISRPILRAFYTNDKGFMEVILDEPVMSSLPEKTAASLKNYFKNS
jgi:galactose-1-phosphate uridylyltransferase